MQTVLLILQIVLSFALVLSILLHPAKGEGLAGIGGPAKVFGSQKGAESGLNKITTGIAILWALSSVLLALPNFVS